MCEKGENTFSSIICIYNVLLLSCNSCFCLFSLAQSEEARDKMPFTVAELGDNLTLICSVSGNEFGLFYWYKLNFGYVVETIASGSFDQISLKAQFDNSRFTVTKVGAHYFLSIRNVSKEDEATYFCQVGSAYAMRIMNGTLLAINGKICKF